MTGIERIDRGYAVIYIDREGISLTKDHCATDDLISSYYKDSGPLQWNYYLIVPEEKFESEEALKEFRSDATYTRKFAVPGEMIDKFVDDTFPEQTGAVAQVQIITGDSFQEAKDNAEKFSRECSAGFMFAGSVLRDHSAMTLLNVLDSHRASLLKLPAMKLIFYSHIKSEISLAKKKFHIFDKISK